MNCTPESPEGAGPTAERAADARVAELIDRCQKALARNATRTELMALIEELADCNWARFRAEEREIARSDSDDLRRRHRHRGRLLEQLAGLLYGFRAGERDAPQRIARFLGEWEHRQHAAGTAHGAG